MTTSINKDLEYLDHFEKKLLDDLLCLCKVHGALDGKLLNSEDIDEHWEKLGEGYIADAIPQVAEYPTVSLAWAAYLGAAVAYGWDVSWETMSKAPYTAYYGERGFDDMDEHITRDILGLDLKSEEAVSLADIFRRCAQAAVDSIYREQIEPQSPLAYKAFIRVCYVMYRIGEAIELKRLGYKYEGINI